MVYKLTTPRSAQVPTTKPVEVTELHITTIGVIRAVDQIPKIHIEWVEGFRDEEGAFIETARHGREVAEETVLSIAGALYAPIRDAAYAMLVADGLIDEGSPS